MAVGLLEDAEGLGELAHMSGIGQRARHTRLPQC